MMKWGPRVVKQPAQGHTVVSGFPGHNPEPLSKCKACALNHFSHGDSWAGRSDSTQERIFKRTEFLEFRMSHLEEGGAPRMLRIPADPRHRNRALRIISGTRWNELWALSQIWKPPRALLSSFGPFSLTRGKILGKMLYLPFPCSFKEILSNHRPLKVSATCKR